MTPHSAELTAVKGMNLKPKELKQFVQNQGTDAGPARAWGLPFRHTCCHPPTTPPPPPRSAGGQDLKDDNWHWGQKLGQVHEEKCPSKLRHVTSMARVPLKTPQGHTEGQHTTRSESHRAVSPQPRGQVLL